MLYAHVQRLSGVRVSGTRYVRTAEVVRRPDLCDVVAGVVVYGRIRVSRHAAIADDGRGTARLQAMAQGIVDGES